MANASISGCARATDINAETLASLQAEDARIRAQLLDVRDQAAVAALVANLPPLDGLFDCTGFFHQGAILDCDDQAWEFSFDLNDGAQGLGAVDLRHAADLL